MRFLPFLIISVTLLSAPSSLLAQGGTKAQFASSGFKFEYALNSVYKGRFEYLLEADYPVEYIFGFLKAAGSRCPDALTLRAKVGVFERVITPATTKEGQQDIHSKIAEAFRQWARNPGFLAARAAQKQSAMNAAQYDGNRFAEQYGCDTPVAQRMYANANAVLNRDATYYRDLPVSPSSVYPAIVATKIDKRQRGLYIKYQYYEGVPKDFSPPIPDPVAEDAAVITIELGGQRGVGGLREVRVEIFPPTLPPARFHAMHFDREQGPIDHPLRKFAKDDVKKIHEDMMAIANGKSYALSCVYQMMADGDAVGVDRYWWKEMPPAADPDRLAGRLPDHPYLIFSGARRDCPPRI